MATAPIRTPAWESPNAAGADKEMAKKKKKKKKKKFKTFIFMILTVWDDIYIIKFPLYDTSPNKILSSSLSYLILTKVRND